MPHAQGNSVNVHKKNIYEVCFLLSIALKISVFRLSLTLSMAIIGLSPSDQLLLTPSVLHLQLL